MNNNRIWILGTAVIAIAVLALGWLLGVSPALTEMSAARDSALAVDTQNQATSLSIVQLKADYEQVDAVALALETLRASMPASANYTTFLNELNTLADQNNAVLLTYSPSAPQVVNPAGEAPIPVVPGEPLPDGTLVAISTDMSVTGTYTDLLGFMSDLQAARRLFLVSAFSFSEVDGAFTVTITGLTYVEIDSSVAASESAVSEDAPESAPVAEETPAPEDTETPVPTATETSDPDATETPAPTETPTDEPTVDPTPTETPAP
jgi:Tfp pilus assembly protein PilO